MKLVRIEGSKDLVKDEETGAVLNSNETEIEAAKIRKEQRVEKENEFETLKNDVGELKDMMKQILEKMNKDG
tara:strand:+ start:81 stop:296 length:216 start_codon:yes stop_codon:yes gene_type:complete